MAWHANDSIRAIAKGIVGASSDRQITTTAKAMGCQCAVVDDLNALEMMERLHLLKFMIREGERAGYTIPNMARL